VSWEAAAGLGIIALVLAALARGFEVRLVLVVGAFALAALTGRTEQILIVFFQGLADATSIVPICSAMGFAYVIREFGCDRHLVRALSRPLLRVRWLLVPGTVAIGFLVNITIISQTSASLAVGTVLVPLLRAFGLRMMLIGSALLLGASIGGELLNPGAPELVAIANKLHIPSSSLVPKVATVLFIHLTVTTVVFLWWNRKDTVSPRDAETLIEAQGPVDWFKAMVPVTPLLLLFVLGPPLELLHWPREWILGPGESDAWYSARLIGLAMLAGCLAACLAAPRQAPRVANYFFEGAGYGYAHIISLIVIAKCFSTGIKNSGVAELVESAAGIAPLLLVPLAGLIPLVLAFLCGSGIGATQGLYPTFADIAMRQEIDPTWIGVVCCIGSAAGRTMSVVAAVTLMCSNLTGSTPGQLSRRVAVPLLIGILTVIGIVMLRVAGRF